MDTKNQSQLITGLNKPKSHSRNNLAKKVAIMTGLPLIIAAGAKGYDLAGDGMINAGPAIYVRDGEVSSLNLDVDGKGIAEMGPFVGIAEGGANYSVSGDSTNIEGTIGAYLSPFSGEVRVLLGGRMNNFSDNYEPRLDNTELDIKLLGYHTFEQGISGISGLIGVHKEVSNDAFGIEVGINVQDNKWYFRANGGYESFDGRDTGWAEFNPGIYVGPVGIGLDVKAVAGDINAGVNVELPFSFRKGLENSLKVDFAETEKGLSVPKSPEGHSLKNGLYVQDNFDLSDTIDLTKKYVADNNGLIIPSELYKEKHDLREQDIYGTKWIGSNDVLDSLN